MDRGILTGLAASLGGLGMDGHGGSRDPHRAGETWLAVVLLALALSITVGSTAALRAATMCSFTAAPSRPR